MERKKMTLRFDLDRPEDRQAWEYLQGMGSASMNKAVLSLINRAERIESIKEALRQVIREEFPTRSHLPTVQMVPEISETDDEVDETIMNFLDSFS